MDSAEKRESDQSLQTLSFSFTNSRACPPLEGVGKWPKISSSTNAPHYANLAGSGLYVIYYVNSHHVNYLSGRKTKKSLTMILYDRTKS